MGFLDNSLGRLGRAVSKAFSTPSASGSVASWLYGAGVALPHEPWAGAWQRNLEAANAAGPNVFAYGPVYACIRIISSDISRLRMQVVKSDDNGIRTPFPQHPAWRLMRVPNEFQTPLQFLLSYMTSKLCSGNTYVLLLRDARGVVNNMYVLDPRRVRVLLDDEGNIYYELAHDPLNGVPGQQMLIPARDIIHDRMPTIWHPLVGVSPMFAAAHQAMIGGRIQMSNEAFFANFSRVSGVLVTPNKIEAPLAKKLQSEWEQNYSARGIGKTAILSNGLDYKPLGMVNAVDSEVINLLRWSKEEIASIFGVPDYKLGSLNKVTYRNTEQMSRDYLQNCLAFHIKSIEQCFNKSLELPENIEVMFDLTDLLRTETGERYKNLQLALQSGLMSINEARYTEDLPPVKGGEEPRVQMQDIPLSAATGEALLKPGNGSNVPAPAPAPSGKTATIEDIEDVIDNIDYLDEDQLEQLSFSFMRELRLGDK